MGMREGSIHSPPCKDLARNLKKILCWTTLQCLHLLGIKFPCHPPPPPHRICLVYELHCYSQTRKLFILMRFHFSFPLFEAGNVTFVDLPIQTMFLLMFMITLTVSYSFTTRLHKSCENGVCFRELDAGPCQPNDDEPRLYRWEPVKVMTDVSNKVLCTEL